jgi:hypothetical protein
MWGNLSGRGERVNRIALLSGRNDGDGMRVHYVEFLYPGAFVSDTSTVRLDDEKAEIVPPKGAFGWRRFWREETTLKGEILKGPPHNDGGWTTYIGARQRLEDIPDTPSNRILRSNMKDNGWNEVVKTVYGQAFGLNPEDRVVSP